MIEPPSKQGKSSVPGSSTPERTPSLREVAARAGVAKSTASRALSNRPGTSARMRERVLDAARELRYEPNLLAQSLSRGATMTVGFLVRDIASPAVPPILVGAERVLRASGYAMLLTNSEGSPELDAEYIRVFRRRRVDGLVLSLSDELHEPTHEELRRLEIPFVTLDRELPPELGASSIHIDHASGLQKLIAHLVALGHRRIGFVGGPPNLRPTTEAVRILRHACERRRGLTAMVESGSFTADHGFAGAVRLLADAAPPTAIVAGNAQILLGALRALADRSLDVPRDVSLASLDDVPYLQFMAPPIASIVRDEYALGRAAAELMVKRLAGGVPETQLEGTSFTPRASIAGPRRKSARPNARSAPRV